MKIHVMVSVVRVQVEAILFKTHLTRLFDVIAEKTTK
jgi:hypothetical protein